MNAQEAWRSALYQLEHQLDRPTFDTWLRDAVLLKEVEGLYTVGARNAYARDMLEHRLQRQVRRVLNDIVGSSARVELEFVVHKPAPRELDQETPLMRLLAEQQAENARQLLTPTAAPLHEQIVRPARADLPEYELNPRLKFDRLVAGRENEMLYAAARAIAERPTQTYNPFFVYGDVGLGKTHLLQAIAHELKARGQRVIYVPSEVFTNDLIDAIRHRTTALFRDRYRSADVLLVDDVQFIAGKDSTQEEFFHTFNALVSFGKQVILASDRPPRDLDTLDARLRSRFAGGLVMDVQPPSLETRMAILRGWAAERSMTLPRAVIERIAEASKVNVRELEGVFNQMIATAQHTRQPITAAVAEHILEGFHRPRHGLTLATVLEVTARHHGLTIEDLISLRRTAKVNAARQIAMYLARELTSSSLPAIGETFGGRTHSTVVHSHKKITAEVQCNAVTALIVADIKAKLVKKD